MLDSLLLSGVRRKARVPVSYKFYGWNPTTQTYCFFDETNTVTALVFPSRPDTCVLYTSRPSSNGVNKDRGWQISS